jgi:mannose-6-phosphate isomerase-like protein (cupin superfamily)
MGNQVVNIDDTFKGITEHWSPKIVSKVNDQYMKVAKTKGEFVWHKHDNEDELFYIIKGELLMEYEDKSVLLKVGDVHVVPRGVMHNPKADKECWIMLIETVSTTHTGDTISSKTKSIEEQLN